MRIGFQTLNLLNINRLKPFSGSNSAINYQGLKQDVFEKSAQPNLSFQGIPCPTKSFEIADVKNLTCPVCQKVMFSDEDTHKFAALVCDKKGEKLIEALDTYGKESFWTGRKASEGKMIYSSQKQQIVNDIKELAKVNPDYDLATLVSLKGLICFQALSQKELEVLDELLDYVKSNVKEPSEKEKLIDIITLGYSQACKTGDNGFKRKKFLYAIKDSVSNYNVQNEIDKIAQKLPSSFDDTDAFFVKYSKESRGNKEIARSLVSGNIATAEHLVCQSDGGGDFLENYICDCAECNSNRMSTPFDVWIKDMPDIEENLQKYLDTVQKLINRNKLSSKYDFYPQGVSKTLFKLSKGSINLKTLDSSDPSFQKMIEKRKEVQNYKEKYISDYQDEIQDYSNRITKLKKIESEHRKNGEIEQANALKQDIKNLYRLVSSLQNKKNEAEKELKLMRTYTKKYAYYQNS